MRPIALSASDLKSIAERFCSRVDDRAGAGECWVWRGWYRQKDGYASMRTPKGIQYVHRIAYALARGETPATTIDHLCKNKLCVNPDHLEPVSQSENILRWWRDQPARDFCKCGNPRRPGARDTRCRECFNAYYREYRKHRNL